MNWQTLGDNPCGAVLLLEPRTSRLGLRCHYPLLEEELCPDDLPEAYGVDGRPVDWAPGPTEIFGGLDTDLEDDRDRGNVIDGEDGFGTDLEDEEEEDDSWEEDEEDDEDDSWAVEGDDEEDEEDENEWDPVEDDEDDFDDSDLDDEDDFEDEDLEGP